MECLELKISTIEKLDQIKADYLKKLNGYRNIVLVCSGAGCISSNCHAVKEQLLQEIAANGLDESVYVIETGCIGTCDLGPVMVVLPEEAVYTRLKPEDIASIVESHLIRGKIKTDKTYVDIATGGHVLQMKDIGYFKNQIRVALRNCGSMDYSSLEAYVARDGYAAVGKAVRGHCPAEVVEEVKKSGLRGRGGGGFPTGIKWEAGFKAQGEVKYIVCNADEGDPGAFMDRSILEGDPHSVIEGMMLGGYAIGAAKGFVYVRAEYPLAIERLSQAIEQARQAGLLGAPLFGTDFVFDLEIRIGAGAFVCGEETALMASIEGLRGEPRQKPPFPFERGLFGQPTIINNVETFANVPAIIFYGADWYTQYGTPGNKGTKVFALAGDINNSGIVEVPMGMSLGDIIFGMGGGIPKRKGFKAAQTGGPSGGCITKEHLNTPVDYDSLAKQGAIMGSGGLIVMDEDTCMVDMARFFMDFIQDESCGKCLPCRTGTKRMLEILERITRGEGREGDIELLEELGETIKSTALCGLGQTAPNPVLSMIHNFREEYEEHIRDKHCRAGVCADLFISPCENACPADVNVPGYIALIGEDRLDEAYALIRKDNPFPAICGRVCTHPCESKCRRGQLDEPLAISDLKRYAADHALTHPEQIADPVLPGNGKKVGIVGAGPSGLTCGYYLAKLGYEVDIYEKDAVAGGVLVSGIPEYRLPKTVVQREINQIQRVGVRIHLDTEVGKDIAFADLRQNYEAVYVATGAQLPNKINLPGEELAGIYHGLDFLRDVNLHGKIHSGSKVAVIGGGNTAIDAARVAVRLGAKEVVVLYRREIEAMPANAEEILDAQAEGVKIIPMVSPVRFIGNEDGHVSRIECLKMKAAGFDVQGRKKTSTIEKSELLIDVDLVIPAVSQSADFSFMGDEKGSAVVAGRLVSEQRTLMTRMEGVFAGGDVARGADTAILAIGDGKQAARSIDRYLGGDGVLYTGVEIAIPQAHESEVKEQERFPMRYLEPQDRLDSFREVAAGYEGSAAACEARRCLRCDRRG